MKSSDSCKALPLTSILAIQQLSPKSSDHQPTDHLLSQLRESLSVLLCWQIMQQGKLNIGPDSMLRGQSHTHFNAISPRSHKRG